MWQRSGLKGSLRQYLAAAASIAATTGLLYILRDLLSTPIVALLYLLPVLAVSTQRGLGPGIVASIGSFLAFNFFFIPPYYTLIVHQSQDIIVLFVFLTVAIVISELVGRVNSSLGSAQARERELIHLYELSADLAGMRRPEAIGKTLIRKIGDVFQPDCIQVLIPTDSDKRPLVIQELHETPSRPADHIVSLSTMRGHLGEIRLWESDHALNEAEDRLLHALAGQGALALERAALAETENRATILEASDQLKSALLSSVSHDLRTPLASITGALSSLDRDAAFLDEPSRHELISTALEQAQRLNRLVGNLLDMTRLEAMMLNMTRVPIDIQELIGVALQEMGTMLERYQVILDIPPDLPHVMMDIVLMSRVLVNILDNAVKYSAPGTPIEICVRQVEGSIEIRISDRGIGVPPENLERIFDKFYRVKRRESIGGTGLGLSISRGFVDMHHGQIRAENRPAGGISVTISLPLNGPSQGKRDKP
jgi:two-component system sensor histidine kinase KdpD